MEAKHEHHIAAARRSTHPDHSRREGHTDADLAELYGVSTKALTHACETQYLEKLKFSKVLPHAFTEH